MDEKVYHRLNWVWGVIPLLIDRPVETFEELITQAENLLMEKNLAVAGDQILIMAGIPTKITKGTNFQKIHRIS